MAFNRPTLPELVDRIQPDFESRLSLTGAVLRRSLIYVLSRVLAGVAHMLYGFIQYLARQLFPDTSEAAYLKRQGQLFGISPLPAQFAAGNVVLTGVDGSVVTAGETLQRSDGVQYTTDADATIASGTATVAVTASVAALAGNCDAAVVLAFVSPVDGVDASATVDTGGLTEGLDQESDDDYRVRVKARLSDPPHGGNQADYVAWAKEVAGVTRAWPYPQELGVNGVSVRFMRDNDENPFPDAGAVAAVQAHIDAVRPVTADVTVVAPTESALAFTIAVVPNTAEVKAAVEAELADLLLREAEPGGTILLSRIRTSIGSAAGLTNYTLTVPAADVTHSTGQLATLGTVTWA